MLVLHPEQVSFDGQIWDGVESVAIDRLAHRLVLEWSDQGPHMVMADVPEQRVRVAMVQRLTESQITSPLPGASGQLRFEVARSASDAGRVRVTAQVVVGEVRHEVTRRGGLRSIVFWAISSDGLSDPVSVESGT
ncbi:MAG: hypothetical protein Kow0022_06430 [Phycisphaerales bacterium]